MSKAQAERVVQLQSVRRKATVDSYGTLSAQIAELEAQRKVIAGEIKGWGTGAYEGDTFRVVVSTYDRDTLDMDAVRGKLSRQFIAANTTTTTVTKITSNARTSEDLGEHVA